MRKYKQLLNWFSHQRSQGVLISDLLKNKSNLLDRRIDDNFTCSRDKRNVTDNSPCVCGYDRKIKADVTLCWKIEES